MVHITRKIPRRESLVRRKPLHATVSEKWTLSTWATLTLAAVVICVVFTVGTHAWHVAYWPKFNQSEVISDLLWIVIAGVIWLFLVGMFLFGVPILLAGSLPGSFLQSEKGSNSHLARDKGFSQHLNLRQLTYLSVLWFISIPALGYRDSPHLTVAQSQDAISGACMAAFFLLVTLGRAPPSMDQNGLFGLDVKALWSKKNFSFEKGSVFLSELVRAGFLLFLVAIYSIVPFFVLRESNPLLISVAADSDMAIFGVVLLTGCAGLFAVALVYGYTQIPKIICSILMFFIWIFIVMCSTASLIEISRIGNVKNITMTFDRKFSPLVGRLVLAEDVGEHLAVAKVDVVFAFGADVVVAKAGSFSTRTKCNFSWLADKGNSIENSVKLKNVRCLALPRTAVYSLT